MAIVSISDSHTRLRELFDRAVRDHNGGTSTRSILNLEKAPNSSLNFQADHPAFIFQVVGQSRDDVPTVVQAGGHHPGSQCEQTITPLSL
jgi:hypothetical protein